MIINFTTTTLHPRTNDVTYWFQVRLPGYECTAIDIGFSESGEFTSASRSFFDLTAEAQEQVIREAKEMARNVVV